MPTQELSRRDPVIARLRLRGDGFPELLRRRRHGRELFGRQLNGARIDLEAEIPTITLLVDDVGEPPELDVDELVGEVVAAAAAAPDALWELLVLAPDRRQILAQVEVPPLGWSTVETGAPASARSPAVAPVVATERSLANGLVTLTVDDDGTVRLAGGGSELVGVGRLVDGGEFGDSYNYGPPADDLLVEAPLAVSIEAMAAGPLLGSLVVRRRYEWPVGVEPSGVGRTAATVTDRCRDDVRDAGRRAVRPRPRRVRQPVARPSNPLARAAAPCRNDVSRRGPVRRRRARPDDGGRARRGAAADLSGAGLRPRGWRLAVVRSPDRIRAGRRRARIGHHGPPLVRAHQPQCEPVPRGPGRARGAGPRRATDRAVDVRVRDDAPRRRLVGGRRPGGGGALSASRCSPSAARPAIWSRHRVRSRVSRSRETASSSAPSAARATGWSCGSSPSTRPRPRRSSAVVSGRRGVSTCSVARARPLPVEAGSVLRLPLGAWEIATVRLR